TISSPITFKEELADHVGAYSTDGRDGSSPSFRRISLLSSVPFTRQSTLGIPTSLAAPESRSIAFAPIKFLSLRSLIKNSRSHSRIERCGLSYTRLYLPATPWNIRILQAPLGSASHRRSETR